MSIGKIIPIFGGSDKKNGKDNKKIIKKATTKETFKYSKWNFC
nr:hypothetical protein [Mycoplasmopsis bovis]